MDNTSRFKQGIDGVRHKLRTQATAVGELELNLAQCARILSQHDQVNSLHILKDRVMQEVEDARIMETVVSASSSQARLTAGLVMLATGIVSAAVTGKESLFSVGAKHAKLAWDRREPFGTVMIAIGKLGLPGDVQVLPVSRLAREQNTSQMHIIKTLRDGGYLLMDPGTFSQLVDSLERKILDGSICLPVSKEHLAIELKNMSGRLKLSQSREQKAAHGL